MTLYLYKIGTAKPVLTVENAQSYTADSVMAADGTVYGPLAEDCELSSVPGPCGRTTGRHIPRRRPVWRSWRNWWRH